MENVRQLVSRWRYLLVVVEVMVGLAAFFAGWRLVTHDIGSLPQVIPPSLAVPAPPDVLGIPWASGAAPGPADRPGGAVGAPGGLPGVDLLARFGREDLALYRQETLVLQVLVDGVREYLVRRVLPAVDAASGR